MATLEHATCVARDSGDAVLLRGVSGAGKSDLALRLIDRGWTLVADDYVELERRDAALVAAPPTQLRGLLEVRGLGLVRKPYRSTAQVVGLVQLGGAVERMPEQWTVTFCGVRLPAVSLSAFEVSAAMKVDLFFECAIAKGATCPADLSYTDRHD